jgi:putative colanic acid biosynthesis acetyltransferase WcaF
MTDLLDASKAGSLQDGPSFNFRHRALRAAWAVVWFTLAAWTPRQFRPWRLLLLRLFGAKLDTKCDVRGSARIWYPPNLVMEATSLIGPEVNFYNMARVTIGRNTIISQRAHICGGTHDYNSPSFQLIVRPIIIGSDVWIAAESFVGPGTVIGDGVVLGARSVAFGTLDPWTVYSGNPARPIRSRKITRQ